MIAAKPSGLRRALFPIVRIQRRFGFLCLHEIDPRNSRTGHRHDLELKASVTEGLARRRNVLKAFQQEASQRVMVVGFRQIQLQLPVQFDNFEIPSH